MNQPTLADSQVPHSEHLEEFVYDDAIVRKFMTATFVWGMIAFLVGIVLAIQLAIPPLVEANAWYSGLFRPLEFLTQTSWLNFGRLRPLHTNAAIFAFAGNAIFAAVYYSTQRLCKARMYSDLLSTLHFWGWQLIIVCAAITLPLGFTQGKEYAELEWPIDLMIAVVWLGFFGGNFFMTLLHRRERHMYVALWFYIATIVTVTILHIGNNIWIPVGIYELLSTGEVTSIDNLMKSYPVYAGVQDAFMQWWYGHNAVAFFLTTPFLGLMYYFVPKAAGKPVYSYRLSIVHFWSLVFIYIWAGPHHLHYTALPMWASLLGMVFSVMLWMPSWGGMINGLLTLRVSWDRILAEPVLKFFIVGVTFYGMSTFEGPLLSVRAVNSLSHYTDWTIGHVHGGTLGWNGFMTFGMIYWLLPRLFQTDLWSKRLADWHFWIGTVGIFLYWISMQWAGITQGLMWRAFDASGQLMYPDFVETVTRLIPLYVIRLIGGLMFLVGAILLGVNFFMTWKSRPSSYETPIQRAAPLTRGYSDPQPPASPLTTNVDAGVKADRWIKGAWHRRLERLPIRFTVWVIIAVMIATLFEMIPTFIIKSNVPTIASVQPYTPLELLGRDIYIAEGCYNCHSQMIRPIYAETVRYGEYSKPGEFVYDHPFQWGSRRLGPDLAREGGRQSDYWHFTHFRNPRDINQNSIMPRYHHLLDSELNMDQAAARVGSMAMLGVPYGDALTSAPQLAQQQAAEVAARIVEQGVSAGDDEAYLISLELEKKKVTALIAYMQRLGTDISKAPPTEEEPPAEEVPNDESH